MIINLIKKYMPVKKVAAKKVAEKPKEVAAVTTGWCSKCEGKGTIMNGHRICSKCDGDCYGN